MTAACTISDSHVNFFPLFRVHAGKTCPHVLKVKKITIRSVKKK
jgi:hypothetical protein